MVGEDERKIRDSNSSFNETSRSRFLKFLSHVFHFDPRFSEHYYSSSTWLHLKLTICAYCFELE